MKVYQYPQYYELAFDYRDIPSEVDFFEAAIAKHSGVPVGTVLEVACGPAPHAAEWHRRGYRYVGLDRTPAMLRYAQRKADESGTPVTLLRGDLRNLSSVRRRFDFAYVTLGSLYVRSNEELLRHLDGMARVLAPGALYVLDGFVRFKLLSDKKQRWTMRRRGVSVRTTYEAEISDHVRQTYAEVLTLVVDDHGEKRTITGRVPAKMFFPQEFLCLVAAHRTFEFVTWCNNFDLRTPPGPKGRQVVILRRRARHRSS